MTGWRDRAGRWLGAWLALVAAHLWLIGPLLQNGDTAVYNEQIEQRLVTIRTTHIGYMLMGVAFDRVLPFGVERNVNLMNLAFAAAGALALVVLARSVGVSRGLARFAALMAFGVHAYLRGAVLGEVDVVACALVMLALAAWASGRPVVAGLLYGLAMLTTPISGLALPMFVLSRAGSARSLRPRWADLGRLALFGAVSLAVYAPVVGLVWQDYVHGGRGILHAPRERWDVAAHVARSGAFVWASAAPWLALALGGTITAIARGISLGVGVLAALGLTALVGERFLDVPVQLPNLCVLSVFVLVVVDRLPRRWAWATLLPAWALTAIPTYRGVSDEVAEKRERREVYRAMAAQTPRMLVVGLQSGWDEGLPFERIVYGRTRLDLGLEVPALRASAANLARTRQGYAIWWLVTPPAGAMDAFAPGWHREARVVRGRRYDVWLPDGGS